MLATRRAPEKPAATSGPDPQFGPATLGLASRSQPVNATNSCATASQLPADWIRLIRFQMIPQLSIMRATQQRELKRLKQATGHVRVDPLHRCLAARAF